MIYLGEIRNSILSVVFINRLIIFVFFISQIAFAQVQNNWIVKNHCGLKLSKNQDSAEFAFHFNFNCEPPCINQVYRRYTNSFGIKILTLSNLKGNLSLFNSEFYGFINQNNNLINSDTPKFMRRNSVLAFPTNSDSIILLVYKSDSVYYSTLPSVSEFGRSDVYFSIYNINSGSFIKNNLLVDFKDKRFQHSKWTTASKGNILNTFGIFNQYIDEKSGNYFLFFNLGDSIFTSRYSETKCQFSKPYFSGLELNKNSGSPLKGALDFGEDFLINSKASTAFFLNSGIYEPYFPTLNTFDNNALFQYKFNSDSGIFDNETLLYSLTFKGGFQNMALSSSDTILYLTAPLLRDSIIKIVFNQNYTSHNLYKIKLPLKSPSRAKDVKLGPNGKVYVLFQESGMDTSILVIENPDDPNPIINFNRQFNLFNSLNPFINCTNLELDIFPLTYGSYRRVKFSAQSSCKGLGMRFANYSDSFWFKQFRYYFGDGDSVDFTHLDGSVQHNYKKSGKYYVKLRAFNKAGAWVWYSDTIAVRMAPSAYFGRQTIKGCQYIQFQFKDSSSITQLKQDSLAKHWWNYGDGNNAFWQSPNKNAKKDMNHVYYASGFYSVSHIVSDGYCVDTFTRLSGVNILLAPKPGIIASDTQGCTPFIVTLSARYKDITDSTRWILSNGQVISSVGQTPIMAVFKNPGHHRVIQMQYGPSGCITTDTLFLDIVQGIDQNLIPRLRYVSVTQEQSIEVKWNNVTNAKEYELYRNNLLYQTLNDTQYTDHEVNAAEKIYQYSFKAVDVCVQKTKMSRIHRNILLNAEKASPEVAILRWTPYTDWPNGIKHYTVYTLQNNNPAADSQINDTALRSYNDKRFLMEDQYQKCYVLVALEQDSNPDSSYSNSVCVPYESVIWIPTAITINGDGINDVLRIKGYGIRSFTFSIYNRWGEKVFETNNTEDFWQPSPEEQGVYMYVIKALSNYGEYLSKGTITVLR